MKRKSKTKLSGQPPRKRRKVKQKKGKKKKKVKRMKPIDKPDPPYAKLPCSNCNQKALFHNGCTPDCLNTDVCYCCYACYAEDWPKHRLKCILPKMKEQYQRYLDDIQKHPKSEYRFPMVPKHKQLKAYRIFRGEKNKNWSGHIVLNRKTANYNRAELISQYFVVHGGVNHYVNPPSQDQDQEQDQEIGFSTEQELARRGFNVKRYEMYRDGTIVLDSKKKPIDFFCDSNDPDFKDFDFVQEQCLNLVQQMKVYYNKKTRPTDLI